MVSSISFGKLCKDNVISLSTDYDKFVITFLNPDTLVIFPEVNWSPEMVLEGIDVDDKTYYNLFDYVCVNSKVLHVCKGQLKLPTEMVKKINFSDYVLISFSNSFVLSGRDKFFEDDNSLVKKMMK
jgi:hypothetical protein